MRPKEYDKIKIVRVFVTVKCLKSIVNVIIKIDQIAEIVVNCYILNYIVMINVG